MGVDSKLTMMESYDQAINMSFTRNKIELGYQLHQISEHAMWWPVTS